MAESVDALVSNTSGFTSIPVRPRVWVQQNIAVDKKIYGYISFEDSFVNERSYQNT